MKRALVISLICVLGLAFSGLAASLSGSWDTDVTIDPTESDFALAIGLTSVLTVVYTVGDWAFTSVTELDDAGWTDQDFSVAGVLGAFTIASDLDFDPDNAEFGSWGVDTGVSIAGVSFTVAFDLEDYDVQLVVGAAGVAGDVGVGVEITFGSFGVNGEDECDLDWQGVEISLDFPFCCADIGAVIVFDCSGFDSITFTTGGIAIPNLPWVTIDAEIVFDLVDGKTLTLSPTFDFGDIVCFDLDISVTSEPVPNAPLVLGDISVDGISLECDIGAVTFTGVTDFDGGLGPNEAYWEYYSIATNDDACCGPFGFDLSFYFLEAGNKLFDVAYIDANMTLQVATQFTFSMGLGINVETNAFTSWTIGFEVTW